MPYEIRSWKDTTPGKSYIERLSFNGDREWTNLEITVKGTSRETTYKIDVSVGNKTIKTFECDNLKNGQEKTYTVENVEPYSIVNVGGYIKRSSVFHKAGAEITVKANYTRAIKSTSVSWHDKTIGASCVQSLGLEADEKRQWRDCSILVKGDQNAQTKCCLMLVVDGDELYSKDLEDGFVISGTSSRSFQFRIDKQASLLVVGYIINSGTGAGATVTLTATYEE